MLPVDDHTLQELQLISELSRDGSILNYFDRTKTLGGRDYLKRLIKKPKQTISEVESAQDLFQNMSDNLALWQVNVSRAYVAASEGYYESNIAHTMSQDVVTHWVETMLFFFRNPTEFYHIENGLAATIRVLKGLQEMILATKEVQIPDEIQEDFSFLTAFLNSGVVKSVLKHKGKAISRRYVFYLDYYFRKQHRKEFRRFLDIVYKLDAYWAIVKTSQEYNLCFPVFTSNGAIFQVDEVWHPLISKASKNSFSLDGKPGICILTGANTSGKTTFLKTVGVVIYLAHLGWPVPASSLTLSFSERLFTSIHLSDDLNLGYSHFYNEVMRIKGIAEALHRGENCVILIDELFRGTNQEDALFCSKTVIDGFINFTNSNFIVSTHLMELLDNYRNSENICFHCFKTKVTGSDFENTFRLEPGIASEKIGKLILQKVGVPELLGIHKN